MRKLAVLGLKNVPSSKMYSVLQLCAINEPLLPNLKTLDLCPVTGEFISCIPFLLSPRTTAISIMFIENDVPTATFASVATALPTLCPNLEELGLHYLPDDPITVAAVSEMLLAANRNTLKSVMVDCPLAVEAREVIYKLSSLYGLMVVIERDTLLPPIVLPNLTKLDIKGNYGGEQLRKFHGAVLGKLESITFSPESESERLGDFLEAFERIALATSAQNTLSEFCLYTLSSWRPNYSSLLSFTHLTILVIESSCDDGCSSITDDDVITDLARAMPKLETLQLGDTPCQPTGVTVKGFVALSHHCLDLSTLCVHFQVASLSAPPEIGGMASNSASTNFQRRDCALTGLDVGSIRVPGESVLTVALTLARIFPRIGRIEHVDRNWGKVMNAVRLSRKIVDCSSKKYPLLHPRSNPTDTIPGVALESRS